MLISDHMEYSKIRRYKKSRKITRPGMVVREGKERRRLWAQRKTPRSSKRGENKECERIQDVAETEPEKESTANVRMLPSDIVDLLASREKLETFTLNDMPPPQCLKNSLEFLKKRKTQVARSYVVLNNPNKALRLLSTTGLLK
ncbi:hypothetical protein Q3G72_023817 [Acer saccharum]|nr:hypothetical protein Q3G72_023817 [Acer saccharum]